FALAGTQLITRVRALDLVHLTRHAPLHSADLAFGTQYLDDRLTVVITKQLPAMLFMPSYTVFPQQCQKILWCISGQCRTAEMRIIGQKIARPRPQVGEI